MGLSFLSELAGLGSFTLLLLPQCFLDDTKEILPFPLFSFFFLVLDDGCTSIMVIMIIVKILRDCCALLDWLPSCSFRLLISQIFFLLLLLKGFLASVGYGVGSLDVKGITFWLLYL